MAKLFLGNKEVIPIFNRKKFNITIDSLLGYVDANGVLKRPNVAGDLIFYGVIDIESNYMPYAFANTNSIRSASFPDLVNLTNSWALSNVFWSCYGLTSVDFSSLTVISGSRALSSAFANSSNLSTVDLSALTTISGSEAFYSAFNGCVALTTVNLSNLQQIGVDSADSNNGHFYNCFNGCTNLTTLTFPKLERIYCTGSSNSNGTFYNCNKIQKLYFPKLTIISYGTGASSSNQVACNYIFLNCSSLTEIHFGAENQAAIEASPGYSTLWGRGAGNATVYFDL